MVPSVLLGGYMQKWEYLDVFDSSFKRLTDKLNKLGTRDGNLLP
jgi:hypothetical protein